jgi:hypothetical protein
MLVGSADVRELAARAPVVRHYLAEPLLLENVTLFQMVLEMRNGAREALLPPSLHPTIPPTLSLQVWQVGESPWGEFGMAVARLSCRGGVRARGFTVAAAASTDAACTGLRETFGYPALRADVHCRASYSGAEVAVARDGRVTFAPLRFLLRPDELAFTGTETIARG